MTNAPNLSQPPRWLPLHVLCGGLLAAVGVLALSKQPVKTWLVLPSTATEIGMRCSFSLGVLILALLLALSLGLAVGLLTRRLGRGAEAFVALIGRALACLPVVALAWCFVSLWIGHYGGPVETLMPTELPVAQNVWQITLARLLWEFLAPALLLAVPLTGEVIQCVISDAKATVDLDFALRARGVPANARLWRHHLSQLLPLLRTRMQALCLVAPVYLIVIEDVLRFMGWGGWMAQSIRAADVNGIAFGVATGGLMIALLCGGLHFLRGRLRPSANLLTAFAWQPWQLWGLGLMTLPPFSSSPWLVLWFAVLLSGCASWHEAWTSVEKQLPLDPARSFGVSEIGIWLRHVAFVQSRMLVAWISAVFAQTLLWIAVACALQPALWQELGAPLARWFRPLAVGSSQDAARTLADPTALLEAGGVIALAALCLIQLSRIIQPRPS
jgi:ABC-type dipeptide/oligopeptide/nickel transport system permease component